MKSIFTGIFLIFGFGLIGQTTLLNENFDAIEIPQDWTIIDNDGFSVDSSVIEYSQAWIVKTDPFDSTNQTISSTSYFAPPNRADRWLITPQIHLGDKGNYISWSGMSHDPSFPDSYKVMISTTGKSIEDFTDTLTVVSNETPFWTNHLHSLKKHDDSTIYIAFVNTTFDGFKLYLDSIYVRSQDPLSVPTEEIYLNIYPNPANHFVTVSGNGIVIDEIFIINSFGQKVFSEAFSKSKTEHKVNLTNLPSGIYFIQIKTANGVFQKKLMKN